MSNPVYLALDVPQLDAAKALVNKVKAHIGGVKLGLEFFNANGVNGVRRVMEATSAPPPRGQAVMRRRVFLDLKFHDIPNTVAGAVRSVMSLAPSILFNP